MAKLQACHSCKRRKCLHVVEIGQDRTARGLVIFCQVQCMACGAAYCTFTYPDFEAVRRSLAESRSVHTGG
jgi:Fe-S-cluster-containing dehydrogenase component